MELSDADIKAFKKFWKSEAGQAIKGRMKQFQEDWLDNAMRSVTQEQIQYYVARSAGVATLVQDFDTLAENKKEKEVMDK